MRAVLHDEIVAGVVGAAAIALVEVIAVGSWRPGLIGVHRFLRVSNR